MKTLIIISSLLLTVLFSAKAICAEQPGREAANSEAIAGRVASIMADEASRGKVKAVVFDFIISSLNTGNKLSNKELKDLSDLYTEEFAASLLKKIEDTGKRNAISLIDRSSLDDILRQKKLSATDISDRSELEIARMAGLDMLISGKVYLAGNAPTVTAKVVRVKDGEILMLVKEDRQKKPAASHVPVIIIDESEKLKIGEWKVFPLTVSSDGTLAVTVTVASGNPIEVYVIPGTEMENFKNHKAVTNVPGFKPYRTKNYQQSAEISSGNYYLILRDNSLGVFSKENDSIKVNVQLQP